jgi:toxin-antitoxin system PIN domain toxin
MKRYLADVDVWFALGVEEHQRPPARDWWDETPGLCGFVRATQSGLLRLLTSAGPMRGQPLTNDQAWAVWDGFLAGERVRVFPDLPALEQRFRAFSSGPQASPKVWVDAYLAAHAAANEATMVTFDQALAAYGCGMPHPIS